jgi:hypothetical protein
MPTKPDRDLHLDRRVSPAFLTHFAKGGFAHLLVEYARHAPFPLDLQFRANPYTGDESAQLYVGTTSVLKLTHAKSGKIRFSAAWTGRAKAHPSWSVAAPPEVWAGRWSEFERYLDDVIPMATKTHGVKEGLVHSAVSRLQSMGPQFVDRETVVAHKNAAVKKRTQASLKKALLEVVPAIRGVKGQQPLSFGDELDLLGVEGTSTLLAVEVKPRNAATIRWAPLQVTMYTELLRRWLQEWEGTGVPSEVISGMRQQRVDVGLLDNPGSPLGPELEVRPIVAVQRGSRQSLLDEMHLVADAVQAAGYTRPELFEIDLAGQLAALGR